MLTKLIQGFLMLCRVPSRGFSGRCNIWLFERFFLLKQVWTSKIYFNEFVRSKRKYYQCYKYLFIFEIMSNQIHHDQSWDLLKRKALNLIQASSQNHPKRIGSIQNTNHCQSYTKLVQLEKMMEIVLVKYAIFISNCLFPSKVE